MTIRLFLLAYWGVVLAQPYGAEAEAPRGRRLALVVGINDYQDSEWRPLRFADKDARDVAKAVSGSFHKVLQLGNRPPTKAAVLSLLDELDRLNTSDLDTVLVYISAHGTLARDAKGDLVRVLVMQDTDSDRPMTSGLAYDDLLARLDLLRSKHKVVLLAACYAGAGKSVLSKELRHELRGLKGAFFAEPTLPMGEGRLVLAASAWGEPAREDASLKNDVYTHFFVEALGGFDRNGDGGVSALEAHDFARTRTMAFTKNRQRPTLSAEIVGEDPIVLVGRRERVGDPIIAAYGRAFEGARLEVDGRYKGTFPGGFVVPSGGRQIRVTRPEADTPIFDDHVELSAGKPVYLNNFVKLAPLQLIPSMRIAWQFTHGDVSTGFLPGFPRVDLAVELARPGSRWRARLRLGGTLINQPIDVQSGRTLVRTRQDLRLVHMGADVSAEILRWSWMVLSARVGGGWSYGQRDLELDTVRPPKQTVSFPTAGAGVEVEFWPLKPIGLRLSSDFELLVMKVEGELQPVASQIHGLSLMWAL